LPEKGQIVFFLLGIGITITLTELFNTYDRLDTYLREMMEERLLYPLTEPALSESRKSR